MYFLNKKNKVYKIYKNVKNKYYILINNLYIKNIQININVL